MHRPNLSHAYDCPACAPVRIERQLQKAYELGGFDVAWLKPSKREATKKRLGRQQKPLGVYSFHNHTELFVISCQGLLWGADQVNDVNGLVSIVVHLNAMYEIKRFVANQYFRAAKPDPQGFDVWNFPKYVSRRDQKKILRLLGFQHAAPPPAKFADVGVETLITHAVEAYYKGKLTPDWTVPTTAYPEDWYGEDEDEEMVGGLDWLNE